ncbi:hypothetical protein R1X32_17165 [Rhodococcus opacus]|nr:hypothetical protein HJ581_0033960 [Rhodococcus opacus]
MTTRYRNKNARNSVAALVARLPLEFQVMVVDRTQSDGGLSDYACRLDAWVRTELAIPTPTQTIPVHDMVHEIMVEIGCPPEEWFRRSMQPELYR